MPLHSSHRLAPLVPGCPLLGNALEMAKDPIQFWVGAARKHGSVFRVRYPTAPGEMTVISGLAANEFATKHGHEVFTTREYYQKLTRETGTTNYICALDGDNHAYFRSVVKPAPRSRRSLCPGHDPDGSREGRGFKRRCVYSRRRVSA